MIGSLPVPDHLGEQLVDELAEVGRPFGRWTSQTRLQLAPGAPFGGRPVVETGVPLDETIDDEISEAAHRLGVERKLGVVPHREILRGR
jgi:hypothetical protein